MAKMNTDGGVGGGGWDTLSYSAKLKESDIAICTRFSPIKASQRTEKTEWLT